MSQERILATNIWIKFSCHYKYSIEVNWCSLEGGSSLHRSVDRMKALHKRCCRTLQHKWVLLLTSTTVPWQALIGKLSTTSTRHQYCTCLYETLSATLRGLVVECTTRVVSLSLFLAGLFSIVNFFSCSLVDRNVLLSPSQPCSSC